MIYRLFVLLCLSVALGIWITPIEPPLQIDGATSLDTVYPNIAGLNQFTYSVAVFSTRLESEPITVTIRVDETRLQPLGALVYHVVASADHAVTVSLRLQVRPGVLSGITPIQSNAIDAHGAVAASLDFVAVCCAPFQEPHSSARKSYLPSFYH